MVTVVVPEVVPVVGVNEVIVGDGGHELVVARRGGRAPGRGDLHLHCAGHVGLGDGLDGVGLVTVKLLAVVVPNLTAVAP